MEGKNNLSKNQFRFRKGKSTIDAIWTVVNIATKAKRGTGKLKGFCVLSSLDKWSLKEEMTCGAPSG